MTLKAPVPVNHHILASHGMFKRSSSVCNKRTYDVSIIETWNYLAPPEESEMASEFGQPLSMCRLEVKILVMMERLSHLKEKSSSNFSRGENLQWNTWANSYITESVFHMVMQVTVFEGLSNFWVMEVWYENQVSASCLVFLLLLLVVLSISFHRKLKRKTKQMSMQNFSGKHLQSLFDWV